MGLTSIAAIVLAAGLLEGRAPAKLTDGEWAEDGEDWGSARAMPLPAGAVLSWDLGRLEPIAAAAIQADNNDDYVLWGSADGVEFTPLWRSGTIDRPGLQTRSIDGLTAAARHLRLTVAGGDGRFSVSELEVHSSAAGALLARLRRLPIPRPADGRWGAVWLVTAAVLTLVGRRSRRGVVSAAGVVLIATAAWLGAAVLEGPAVRAEELNWMRAMVGAIAFAAVLRERLFPVRHPAHPGLVLGVLGATAAMGLLCFVNLGRPQFIDAGRAQPTFLHHYDMRTYFPIARYFPELRFDGIYAASAMAVADDRGGLDALAAIGIRDLRTHAWTTVGASRAHLVEVRGRFSPQRWESFVRDLGYFRRAMGDAAFLASMADHGGNATPVWLVGARATFAALPASDFALGLGVALDAALMVLAFVALGWAFGPRTALLAMIVFGAMDFYQFGTNWFGAALRHDWLALWGLGLAALKKERFALAGAVLAWAALIRAFPALTFATLAIPAGWDAGQSLLGGTFTWEGFAGRQRALVRVGLGAGAFGGLLVAVTGGVFGPGAWVEWLAKAGRLNAGSYINSVALRGLLPEMGWVRGAAVVLVVVLVTALNRRARPWQAAAWGVALLPIALNPANYYLHSVMLLVVLAGEGRGGKPTRSPGVWLVLTAMCFASYFTWVGSDARLHFSLDTFVLLAALAGVFACVHHAPPSAADPNQAVGPPSRSASPPPRNPGPSA